MKSFKILGAHWKIRLLGEESSQKIDIETGIVKRGGLDSLQI